MIVNPQIFGSGDGVDTSQDTVTARTLTLGYTAHDASGAAITGSAQQFSFSEWGTFQYPETVIVPNTVRYIPSDTNRGFYQHEEIKHVIFEDGELPLAPNGWYCFANCTGLIDCVLPSRYSNTQMPDFEGCTSLVSVNIPASVTSVSGVFKGCTSLTSFAFPNNVTIISGTFNGCTRLASVTLPDSITEIGDNTFYDCTALTAVELPAALRKLGTGVFRGSGITSIVLPATLSTLESSAFRGVTGLKTIVFNSIPTSSYYTRTDYYNPFYESKAIEDVQLPAGWTENIVISTGSSYFTNVLTHDSMVAMIANLYDYSEGTAHTLRLGATNLARLSEEEIAAATAKNWTVT